MPVCSVSTSWLSRNLSDARRMIDAVKETGVDTVELDFRISREMFNEILKNREAWSVSVSSLHAVCPALDKKQRGAEKFLISDTDEENRRLGVKHVTATIQNAVELGALAVILHCGKADMKEPIYEMMKLFDSGAIETEQADAMLNEFKMDRLTASRKNFDSLLKSLDEINMAAVKIGIDVGLENRYYFAEYPNLEEFGIIFNLFGGGRLRYWHDTGHAHVQELLFGLPQRLMLETFQSELAGIHLHDVNGYTDHNEPGSGEVDFDMVASYLNPQSIRVMELNPRVDPEGAKRGLAFLQKKGIFTSQPLPL